MRRLVGPIVTVLLVAGLGVAIYRSVREQLTERQTVAVRGLIGSEKEEFFKDATVLHVLRRRGFDVHVEKAGSREIAGFDLRKYDFAFPAGIPAAEKIRREHRINPAYVPFFTPMAIASWRTIAEILQANGMAEEKGGYYTLDMGRLLDIMAADTRWKELPHNTAYAVNKSILVNSTDVRKSNSAAMYLSLASFLANGSNVVENEEEIARVLPLVQKLFLKQGFVENSSEGPFENYLLMGIGKAPLVMIYESQFISHAASANGGITPEMVLMYPRPTVYTKHVLVPLSEGGDRLGELLATDPELQRLAVQYGFRTSDANYFREFTRQHKVAVADTLIDVVEPPSYETIERMIQHIEERYREGKGG
jgi:hypothetical protein